jgi:hypothetical protein
MKYLQLWPVLGWTVSLLVAPLQSLTRPVQAASMVNSAPQCPADQQQEAQIYRLMEEARSQLIARKTDQTITALNELLSAVQNLQNIEISAAVVQQWTLDNATGALELEFRLSG